MPTPQEILAVLSSGDSNKKVLLLQALVKKPESGDEIAQKIIELTRDEDIAVRFWSKKAVAKLKPQEATPPKPTEEPKSLSVDVLLQKLNAVESTFVSLDVIKQLCESRDPSALQPLIDYLQRCQDPVQVSYLVKQIGINFPSEQMIPILAPFLKHDDDRVVANTVEGLEALGSPKCVVLFAQLLDHSSSNRVHSSSNRVRSNCAKALSKAEPEKTFEILTRMLQSEC